MRTCPFEPSNGFNWGRFLVGMLGEEWGWYSSVEPALLVNQLRWGSEHLWVLDLVTGEGAWLRRGEAQPTTWPEPGSVYARCSSRSWSGSASPPEGRRDPSARRHNGRIGRRPGGVLRLPTARRPGVI